ncbi:MAG: hypothetical protein JXJ20_06255, partial [Anaerolineae bacterium]|nr:hypothetical protein [Anaerolineae bacterium]
MCQNAREQRHLFALAKNGFVNLGLGVDVSGAALRETLERLIMDADQRRTMSRLMLAADIRGGTARVVRLILDAYAAFEREHKK